MNDNFVHHHVHSYFSELDGLRSPEKIAETVAKMGQPGISITDHGSMSGIPSMFRAAQKYGLIFTPGIESYWAPDRTKHAKDIHGKSYYHLTLLAHTWEGYQSLVKQQSSAWEEGFYHKPRIDNTLLEKYHTDMTILTGCLGSASSQAMLRALQRGDSEDDIVRAGCDVVGNYIDIVGKDHVFVEVHNHNIPEEHLILPYQVKMAHALGLPLVAAHDTHYCTAADAEIHDHLLCMQTKAKATDQHRFCMDTNIRDPHFFLTTRQEMEQLFPDDQFPGALDNTLDIMERSHFDMPMGDKKTYLMPKVDVPDGETEASHLRSLVMEGARDVSRYGDGQGNIPQKVQERIDYELSVIDNMGFNGYFLIVRTIVDIMVDNNINKGPGRGSAPGSIVSYCLGITDLDPLAYNLFFERFLNPARVSMPDIDMDVDKADRGRLLELIQHHFGTNHVAHIANYTAMKDRAAITAICRTKGILPQHGHIFSDSIMEWVDENDDVTTLADAFEAMMRTNHIPPSIMSAIRERVARTPHKDVPPEHVLFDIIRLASELSGTLYSFGIHACGIIITDTPLDDIFPLRRNKSAVLPVCQYDKDDTEDLGAVKMDILGLKNLGICSQTEHKILRDLGENIQTYSLPLDDGDTYMMLAKGDSDGVFQLESDGMKQLLRELRPTEFSDITACVALYRPGPMGMNAHMSFAHRKNGEEPVEVFHPDMGEILHDTYGLCLAPDTIVHIANDNTTMTVAELATTMAHIPPIPVRILSYDTEHNTIVGAEVTHCWTSGIKDVYRVTLDNGYTVDASLMHPFLTQRGWVTVGMLKPGIDQVMCTTIGRFNNCTDPTLRTVSSVRYIRTTATYDITVEPTHTLLVNDGAVVSNCVYQEQIMSIAQHYAGYSASEADNLRKAMAKKNDVLMEENRRKFIPAVDSRFEKGTGQGLWDIVAPFASYAFNKCLVGRTRIVTEHDGSTTIEKMYRSGDFRGKHILSMWEDGSIRPHTIKNIVKVGRKPVYGVKTEKGRTIYITKEHRMLTTSGYGTIEDGGIAVGAKLISDDNADGSRKYYVSDDDRERRSLGAVAAGRTPQSREAARQRMANYQRTLTYDDRCAHQQAIEKDHPGRWRHALRSAHERTYWLHHHDTEWRTRWLQRCIESRGSRIDTDKTTHFGGIRTMMDNGDIADSMCEAAAGNYLLSRGVDFELHKIFISPTGHPRVTDFYANGIYFEMDGLRRGRQWFIDNKYGDDIPFVYMTPLDYKDKIDEALMSFHVTNGDRIVEIIEPRRAHNGEQYTQTVYDIEMEDDGPSNFIANGLVSHNSHAAAYALTSYRTAWLKCHYPAQFGAAIIDSADRDEYLHHIHWIVSGGTTVHLPDINLSGGDTVTTTNSLTLPFSMIERVGETVSHTIAEECERGGDFSSVYDAVERLGATVAFLTPLVKAGCFDRLHNRGALLTHLPAIVASAQKMAKSKAAANDGFFALIDASDTIIRDTTPDIDLDHYPDDGVFYGDRTWFPHEEQQLYRQLEKETLGFSHDDTVDLFRKREDLFRKFAREQRGCGMVFLSPRALLRRLNAGDIIPRTANIMGIVKDCKVMTKNKTFTVLTIVGADFVSVTVAIGRDVTQEIPGLASGITGQSVCVGDLSLNSWKRRISSHDWIWANSIIDISQTVSTL